MTGSTDLLASVKTKVEKLINHCEKLNSGNAGLQTKIHTLESEKEQLQQMINHLHKELESRQAEIAELYSKTEVLKNAESLNHQHENAAEVKTRINDLMREIDNCIALLSK